MSKMLSWKQDWSQGFGAYLHNPQSPNRYAVGNNVDASNPHKVILAPLENSLALGTNNIGLCFGEHRNGGTTKLYIGGTTSTREVYRLINWATTPDIEVVLASGTGGTPVSIVSFGGYIFVGSAPYAYSQTGDNNGWTDSTLTGDGDEATHLLALSGTLHKLYGTAAANHAQVSAIAAALNGGAGWSSADAIGDGTLNVAGMRRFNDGLAFLTERGPVQFDYAGNVVPIALELMEMAASGSGASQGGGADVWRGRLYWPQLYGGVYALAPSIGTVDVTPALQQQRRLESPVATSTANIDGVVYWVQPTSHALYAFMRSQTDATYRLLKCIEIEGRHIWHTSTVVSAFTGALAHGISYESTSGPVIWMAHGTTTVNYIIIPTFADPEQDSRSTYATSGTLYDPWDEGGAPGKLKLWDKIWYNITTPTSTTMKVKVVADNGQTILPQQAIEAGYHTIALPAGSLYRKIRLEWELGTSAAGSTPVLNAYGLFGEISEREE